MLLAACVVAASVAFWPALTVDAVPGGRVAAADDAPALRTSAETIPAPVDEVRAVPPQEAPPRGRVIDPQTSESGPLIIKVPRAP
ncbi:hypothetical protein [Terrihabitans rhizophilus]|uniref:Uncharacterized protein n=1 Tax=Terrihabitans rhizophilus TaxID=3092662 RepID=A0ABU4RMU3_9HYPH|nr:hypothetical protein [Terrihabitans sp. PJ23]MDX6806129.1 hypothetical protein [Terrihabitans sp. PJ23]